MAKEYSVYELNRIQQYIMQMRPVLKKEALFSDGTKDYRDPTEPEAGEKVTIRFRTGRNNVDIVWLCTDCEHYKMKKTESDHEFDYYTRSGGILTGSASFRDFPHRSGQREPSCTRSLWIVFTMVIRLTMC